MADVQRAADRRRRRVDGEDLLAGLRPVERVDARVVPYLRPPVLKTVKGGLLGHGGTDRRVVSYPEWYRPAGTASYALESRQAGFQAGEVGLGRRQPLAGVRHHVRRGLRQEARVAELRRHLRGSLRAAAMSLSSRLRSATRSTVPARSISTVTPSDTSPAETLKLSSAG